LGKENIDEKTNNYKQMKKIFPYIIVMLSFLFIVACNDEWEEEMYEKTISFGKPGVVPIYLKYTSEGGVIPYKLPVVVTGTTDNDRDIDVSIKVDNDTVAALNFERFRYRTDLHFIQLDSENYEFESMNTTIPKGENSALINLNLKVQGLDLINKYILPLRIATTSSYYPTTRKYYDVSMLEIVPFNDYSGIYSASSGLIWDRTRSESSQTALNVPTREARVVDENSIFFFAGVTEQEDKNRATYKLKASFDVIGSDSLVTLTADSAKINFSQQKGTFSIQREMDPLLPYLERRYIIVELEYEYDDITNPSFPLKYRFKGSMTLERKRNTLIPEEDQQEIF
jgi:hypothetical protein